MRTAHSATLRTHYRVRIVILTNGSAVVQHWPRGADNARGYSSRRRHAPRTMPLMAKARKGRPMLMRISGHGFVSNAENTAMVVYSTNKNANQQTIAIFNPVRACAICSFAKNQASA